MEKFWAWIASHLPRNLVKWCFLRVAVDATQGEYSDQEVPTLTVIVALQRWMEEE